MRKNRILIICILLSILGNIFMLNVKAETFDIGKNVSESDLDHYDRKLIYFDSESIIYANPDYKDYLPLIFDGNESTGIDHDFGASHEYMNVKLIFPTTLYVNYISVKPFFHGSPNVTKYSLGILYGGMTDMPLTESSISIQKTFQINCKIEGLTLELINSGTNHFYFNDVIINYTPISSGSNDIQKQINKINQDIDSIYNDINVLKNDIIEIKENISDIRKNMPSEYNDSALQDQINNLTQEINSLKENLTIINNSIPSKYNDSFIKSNILSLETENIFLKQQIGNLTVRINNLTTEIEKLSSEVQNLQGVGGEKTNDTDQDYRTYEYSYPIIFGIIIIILLLIILKLSLTILKRKPHEVEKPKPGDILISKIKYDILTNKEIKDSRLYDDEYKRLLENGYQKGEMSQETYNYIKSVLEVSDKPQNLKK